MNSSKKWVQSRLVLLGILGCVVYALKLLSVDIPTPTGDLADALGAGISLLVIILRFRTNQKITP